MKMSSAPSFGAPGGHIFDVVAHGVKKHVFTAMLAPTPTPNPTPTQISGPPGDNVTTTNYYAVRKGHTRDIFESWEECPPEVEGITNDEFKGFKNLSDAQPYLNTDHSSSCPE